MQKNLTQNKKLVISTDEKHVIFACERKNAIAKLHEFVKKLKTGQQIEFANGLIIKKEIEYPAEEKELVLHFGFGKHYRFVHEIYLNERKYRSVPISKWKRDRRFAA